MTLDFFFCFIASLRFIGGETPLKLLFFTRKALLSFNSALLWPQISPIPALVLATHIDRSTLNFQIQLPSYSFPFWKSWRHNCDGIKL